MTVDTTLLDLDRVPTMDELKAFFKKHDWSAAKNSEPCSREPDKVAEMKEIKKIMNAEFEQYAREHGLQVASKYYENRQRVKGVGGNTFDNQGNPLLELRDGTEDLVADAVYEIAVNHEDILDGIFSQFDFSDPEIDRKADELLHNAVGTMLDVMEYEKLAQIVNETSAFEDYNPNLRPNFHAENHQTKWYHLDTKHPTLPDPDVEELRRQEYPNVEDVAISNLTVEEYWNSIDKKDQTILRMLMCGYTQNEVADAVGMTNNSGVSKRVSKLRDDFIRKTGMRPQ